MAVVVNNPGPSEDRSGSAGWAVAIVILLLVILFILFVWPGLRAPAPEQSPGEIDVNIEGNLPSGGNQGGNQNQETSQ